MAKESANSFVWGVILIVLGLLLLLVQNFPGIDWNRHWPLLFFMLSLMFGVMPFLQASWRPALAALLIPAAIFLALGIIFYYASTTNDWISVAYSWTLIPGGVGLGLYLAAVAGGWGRQTRKVGWMMLAISLGVFSLFAALFARTHLETVAAAILILIGLFLLVNALRHTR